jgi:hypothetical protein
MWAGVALMLAGAGWLFTGLATASGRAVVVAACLMIPGIVVGMACAFILDARERNRYLKELYGMDKEDTHHA